MSASKERTDPSSSRPSLRSGREPGPSDFVLPCLFIAILLGLTACTATPSKDDSLYRALGGEDGIERLIGKTVELAHEDPRIAFMFEDADDGNLIEQLEDQICELSGGPCEYTGLDMEEAHSGMEITEAEFDVFVERVIDAMEETGVPHPARNRLLALLAPMREQVIHQ
jgi:hemoglobin